MCAGVRKPLFLIAMVSQVAADAAVPLQPNVPRKVMNNPSELFQAPPLRTTGAGSFPNVASAVSWSAILAGAAAAATFSLILLLLGTGLGLSIVSPWAHTGIGAAALGLSAILWVTLTQLVASGLGGYLAGRLRTRWTDIHGDEVYFRDTAHGLLTWAVATLATAALLSTAAVSVIGAGVQTGTTLAATATTAAAGALSASNAPSTDSRAPMAYLLDAVFQRADNATGSPEPPTASTAGQSDGSGFAAVGRIFMNSSAEADALPAADLQRAGQIVARDTGLSQGEAEQRVAKAYAGLRRGIQNAEAAAKDAANKARKISATTSLWLFISLLIGAFVASYAATLGGRQRDL